MVGVKYCLLSVVFTVAQSSQEPSSLIGPCKPQRVWNCMPIHRGIHVYLTRERARQAAYFSKKVFKCTAKIKDLIGVSTCNGQAAFMKIHVTPEEFDRGKKGRN